MTVVDVCLLMMLGAGLVKNVGWGLYTKKGLQGIFGAKRGLGQSDKERNFSFESSGGGSMGSLHNMQVR